MPCLKALPSYTQWIGLRLKGKSSPETIDFRMNIMVFFPVKLSFTPIH